MKIFNNSKRVQMNFNGNTIVNGKQYSGNVTIVNGVVVSGDCIDDVKSEPFEINLSPKLSKKLSISSNCASKVKIKPSEKNDFVINVTGSKKDGVDDPDIYVDNSRNKTSIEFDSDKNYSFNIIEIEVPSGLEAINVDVISSDVIVSEGIEVDFFSLQTVSGYIELNSTAKNVIAKTTSGYIEAMTTLTSDSVYMLNSVSGEVYAGTRNVAGAFVNCSTVSGRKSERRIYEAGKCNLTISAAAVSGSVEIEY